MTKENHKTKEPYNLELVKREAKYWQTDLKNLSSELDEMPRKLVERIVKDIQNTLDEIERNLKQPSIVE